MSLQDISTGVTIGAAIMMGANAIGTYDSEKHRADIGVQFEDGAVAATLRDHKALPEDAVKRALDEAFENYRNGKHSVISIKLPKATPAPGN